MFDISKIQVRWMIRRDIPEVLTIENESFEYCWTEEEFINSLKKHNHNGMVAENIEGVIIGYMVYRLVKEALEVLNFAVKPEYRRKGVGTHLVNRLKSKLTYNGCNRQKLILDVRETNLPAQLFFRRCGLRANSVIREYYQENNEDAYNMCYDINQQSEEACLTS